MPLSALVTASVETAINKALALKDEQLSMLLPLQHKRLIVFLDVFPQGLTFVFNEKVDVIAGPATMDVAKDELDANTCVIETKLSALDKLKDTSQLTILIQKQELVLLGDISIAQQVTDIAKGISFDAEEWLAQRTSDVFAHSLFSFAQSAHNTILDKLNLLAIHAADLAIEERPIAARKQGVDYFCDQVSQLRDDAARLEARLSQLEQKCD